MGPSFAYIRRGKTRLTASRPGRTLCMVNNVQGCHMFLRRAGILVFAAALASTLAAAPAAAQGAWPVALGARVRVTAPSAPAPGVVGTVVGLHRGELVLRPDGRRDSLTFARDRIATLDVSTGRHGHAMLGTGIGFVAGAIVGAINGTRGPCSNGYNCNGWNSGAGGAALGGAVFGIVGAPVGAIVGDLIQTERWNPVDLGTVHAAAGFASLGGSRAAIRISLRF